MCADSPTVVPNRRVGGKLGRASDGISSVKMTDDGGMELKNCVAHYAHRAAQHCAVDAPLRARHTSRSLAANENQGDAHRIIIKHLTNYGGKIEMRLRLQCAVGAR